MHVRKLFELTAKRVEKVYQLDTIRDWKTSHEKHSTEHSLYTNKRS